MSRLPFLCVSMLVAAACTGEERPPGTPATDASRDTSFVEDARADGADVSMVDSGSPCTPGLHLCDGACIGDRPADPAVGCQLGCGAPCPDPPPDAFATCSAEGLCDFECVPPLVREGTGCVCAPRTCVLSCGDIDDGCGATLRCGGCGTGSCIDSACVCDPDPYEVPGAFTIPVLDDADDPVFEILDSAIGEADDIDSYSFDIVDGPDGTLPDVTLRLTTPLTHEYRVRVDYACGTTRVCTDAECRTERPEPGVMVSTFRGMPAACAGTARLTISISNNLWIRNCEEYQLTLSVR